MKAFLIGIAFFSLAGTLVFAQDGDWGDNCPCDCCFRPPKHDDCGSTKCGKPELAQDRKIKEELGLLPRAHLHRDHTKHLQKHQ